MEVDMLIYLRQLLIAMLGGAVAAGILLVANQVKPQPSIALAQTSVSVVDPASTEADAPKVINYQGQVFDPNTNQPLRNQGLNFSFRIYNNAGGTGQLFQDDRFVQTNADGFFNTNIGAPNKFGGDVLYSIFNGQELYLGVFINNQQLGPLQPISFVPYAFWSVHAHHLDNYDADDFPKIVAYGVVNGDGGRAEGEHFNSSRGDVAGSTVYIIDIPGVDHTIFEYTTIVTPACDAPVMHGVGTSEGDLLVDIWDPNGIRTTCRFEFMVLEK
jgi:hypothetical protein